MANKVFNTDKRIKLGVWGLGRGGDLIACCKALNIDVVAGCDGARPGGAHALRAHVNEEPDGAPRG